MPVETIFTTSTASSSTWNWTVSANNLNYFYIDKYGNNYPIYDNNGNYPYLQDPEPKEPDALWEQI